MSKYLQSTEKRVEFAIEQFAKKFANTGCDDEEAMEFARYKYDRILSQTNSIEDTLVQLDIEAMRYEDM